jgi:hypothetical protein
VLEFECECDDVALVERFRSEGEDRPRNVEVTISRGETQLLLMKNVLLTVTLPKGEEESDEIGDITLTKRGDLSLPTYYARHQTSQKTHTQVTYLF